MSLGKTNPRWSQAAGPRRGGGKAEGGRNEAEEGVSRDLLAPGPAKSPSPSERPTASRRRAAVCQQSSVADKATALSCCRSPGGQLLGFPAAAPPPRSSSPPLSQGGILPDKSLNPHPDTPSLPPSSPPPGLLPRCSIPPDAANSRPASCWHLGHTPPPAPCCSSPAGRCTVQISAPGRAPAGSRAAFRVVAPLNTAGFRRLEPANGRKLPRGWNSFSVTHGTVQMSRWHRKGRTELDTGAPGALSKSGCGRETSSCSTRRFPTADNERKEKKPAPTAVYRGKLQGPLLPE